MSIVAKRFVYDRDLEEVVEVRGNYFEERGQAPSVISDDIGAGVDGLRVMHRMDGRRTDSKSAYRKDVKEAGLAEVGTERNFASPRERPSADYYGQQVRDAADQLAGNWNGTRDWLQREKERGGR